MKLSISTTTTLRADVNITFNFISYYLNIGISHMFLFFDDPNDPAIPLIKNHPQLTCIGCDKEHWNGLDPNSLSIEDRQHYNSKIGLELARDRGDDWIIHVDSDELIYCKEPIEKFFGKIDPATEVVNFPTLEAVADKMEFKNVFIEVKDFKCAPPQIYGNKIERVFFRIKYSLYFKAIKIANQLGVKKQFAKGFVLGHILGKSATRTSADVKILGNHYPTNSEGKVLYTRVAKRGWVLHYDSCGFDSWFVKWERRYNNMAKTVSMPPVRQKQGDQFLNFYRSNDKEKLGQFYRQLYYLSNREKKILQCLGLLKRVCLDKSFFKNSIIFDGLQ